MFVEQKRYISPADIYIGRYMFHFAVLVEVFSILWRGIIRTDRWKKDDQRG